MRCKVSNFLADGDINKRKGSKGLEHTNSNGSSSTSNGTKHHLTHQDNHRTSQSVPNSRNNSGGNNTKCNKKEMLDMEHSSVSTDSSTHSSNSTASKLSKVSLGYHKTRMRHQKINKLNGYLNRYILKYFRLDVDYVIVVVT